MSYVQTNVTSENKKITYLVAYFFTYSLTLSITDVIILSIGGIIDGNENSNFLKTFVQRQHYAFS